MDKIILVTPNIQLKSKALDYRQEHFDFGETVINGSELFDKTPCYEEWLERITANSNKKRRTILSTLLMIIVASVGTVFCVAGLVLYIIERGGTIL